FEADRRPLRRADNLADPRRVALASRPLVKGVEFVVAVGGVVVEESEAAGTGLLGNEHRVVDRAMTPVGLLVPLLIGVLSIMDEKVNAVGQFADTVRGAV